MFAWDKSRSWAMAEDQTRWHKARVLRIEFIANDQLVISADASGLCHLWNPTVDPPIATFAGHSTEITSIAFDVQRELFAAGAADGSLRVWQRQNASAVAVLVGHTAPVTQVLFVPDTERLVSASADGTLRVWEPISGRCLATLRCHTAGIVACATLPRTATFGTATFGTATFGTARFETAEDWRILSASKDGLIKLWTPNGEIIATLGGHDGPIADLRLGLSDDDSGVIAVSCSDDRTVRVWNLATGTEARVLRGHAAAVVQAAPCGPKLRWILSVDAVGGCRLWEHGTGRLLREFKIGGGRGAQLAVSRDGSLAACVSEDGSVARIDLSVEPTRASARDVALDSTGARLVIGSAERIHFAEWRLPSAFSSTEHLPAGQNVIAVRWTGSSYLTLTDTSIVYWSRDGRMLDTYTMTERMTAVAISADGSVVVVGHARGDAAAFQRVEGQLRPIGSLQQGRAPVTACACAANGHALAAGADGTLRLWDTSTGAVLQEIRAHARPIVDCDMSHDGSMLLSASTDGTLRVWDARGTMRRHIDAHNGAISGCWLGSVANRAITCSRDRTVKLWDLDEGRCLETYYGEAPFVSLAVAPQGPIAAGAATSGQAVICSVPEGFHGAPHLAYA